MIEQISEATFRHRCEIATFQDAVARGLTPADISADLMLVDWLESMVAVPMPEPDPRPVAQPNWDRLGFAGIEDAEGRN